MFVIIRILFYFALNMMNALCMLCLLLDADNLYDSVALLDADNLYDSVALAVWYNYEEVF